MPSFDNLLQNTQHDRIYVTSELDYTADTINLKGNKFVAGVKIKATVDAKLTDSPAGSSIT